MLTMPAARENSRIIALGTICFSIPMPHKPLAGYRASSLGQRLFAVRHALAVDGLAQCRTLSTPRAAHLRNDSGLRTDPVIRLQLAQIFPAAVEGFRNSQPRFLIRMAKCGKSSHTTVSLSNTINPSQ